MGDDTLDRIGKRLTGGERRDAVHFAVIPITVKGFLRSGERVKLVEGRTDLVETWGYDDKACVGVIDPFLTCGYVADGDRCWLFLLPNTITGLRHEWDHPAFAPQPSPVGFPADLTAREYSEKWLRGFAEKYETSYRELISGATSGEGVAFGDDLEYSDFQPGSEFWHHMEIVSGQRFSEDHITATPFRCSC